MSLAMLAGLLFMGALAGVDAWMDHSPRKPLSWKAFLGARQATWWADRRTKAERSSVAISLGKEA